MVPVGPTPYTNRPSAGSTASWVSIAGDALTLAAGILRVRPLPFLLLVSIGKAERYAAILTVFIW